MAKAKKTADDQVALPKRILDRLPEGWADAANSMKEEELKKEIIAAEGNIYSIEHQRDNDANLQKAKEEAKDLGAGYRDSKNCQQAKIRYSLFLLEGRGYDLDTQDAKE